MADYLGCTDAVLRRRIEAPDGSRDQPDGAALPATHGIFLAEGWITVREVVRLGYAVRSYLVVESDLERLRNLLAETSACHPLPPSASSPAPFPPNATPPAILPPAPVRQLPPIYLASRAVIESITGYDVHRGLLASVARPAPLDPRVLLANGVGLPRDRPDHIGSRQIFLVLEGIADQENLGAIFRHAAAFGIAGVLADARSADPLYRRSVRVSLGHVLHVPFARLVPWPAALSLLTEHGVATVALTTDAGAVPISEVARHDPGRVPAAGLPAGEAPLALLLGAEGSGLSRAALDAASCAATIPLSPGVDSLNVATAAAIACYELRRVAER